MRAARRCTAPMKAPSPPPTMPYLILPSALSVLPVMAIVVPLTSFPLRHSQLRQPECATVGFLIDAGGGEVVEGLLGHMDDLIADECGAFAGAIFGMLDAAFPFQHRPALVAVLRQ